jgi:acetyl-CoA carboxylase biotin carboxyl carrier protein
MKDVLAEVTGSVWKVLLAEGQPVNEGDTIMIVESMKMEIPVEAPIGGVLDKLHVKEGDGVQEGATVATIA